MTRSGYGQIGVGAKKVRRVNRVAWEVFKGPIPVGLSVLHHCDNRRCFNPDHLFLGTQKDNMQDAKRKGRCQYVRHTGEGHGSHILTALQVASIRDEYRPHNVTRQSLAIKYGVSPFTIRNIIYRRTWK